jgi:hypothetical protein
MHIEYAYLSAVGNKRNGDEAQLVIDRYHRNTVNANRAYKDTRSSIKHTHDSRGSVNGKHTLIVRVHRHIRSIQAGWFTEYCLMQGAASPCIQQVHDAILAQEKRVVAPRVNCHGEGNNAKRVGADGHRGYYASRPGIDYVHMATHGIWDQGALGRAIKHQSDGRETNWDDTYDRIGCRVQHAT